MKTADVQKDDRLTVQILVESMVQQLYDPALISEFDHMARLLFGLMDANQDGYIQPDEYKILLKHLSVPEGTFDAKFAFEAIDVNGDGKR